MDCIRAALRTCSVPRALVASGSFLYLPHPPARAQGSSSSSGHSVMNIVGNSRKYLGYEQESVQVQEEEKD
jgi:hypothetical protein